MVETGKIERAIGEFSDFEIKAEAEIRGIFVRMTLEVLSDDALLDETDRRDLALKATGTSDGIAEIRKAYEVRDTQHFNVLMDRMLADIS